ncbi:DUF1045 domain-containing protein [Pseudoroseomonas globiformis]|uniref:DUF1045 domain-containing protein n=1 Tax=Teichococcus globiformis TaxID=2307229 RepID=A0ABV7G571_9PROT
MRVALYWAPRSDDPLHRLGSQWLGRDAERGVLLGQPEMNGFNLWELTSDARRYGLHATLKAPFHLQRSFPEFVEAVDDVARSLKPFELPALQVSELDGFLALTQKQPSAALQHLAETCVSALDAFRPELTDDEIARRKPDGLGQRDREYLMRWGYPYVFESWRFHVTLSCRLSGDETVLVKPHAERHFQDALAARPVQDICIFSQDGPAEPFRLVHRAGFEAG